MKRKYFFLIAIIILPLVIILLELFSKSIIYIYRNYYSSPAVNQTSDNTKKLPATSNNNSDLFYSDKYKKAVSKDVNSIRTKFSSYFVWDQLPIETEHLNININGLRNNRENIKRKSN